MPLMKDYLARGGLGKFDRALARSVVAINEKPAMSSAHKSLAQTMRDAMAGMKARAVKLEDEIKAAAADMEAALDKAEAVNREIRANAAELHSLTATETNGGPE